MSSRPLAMAGVAKHMSSSANLFVPSSCEKHAIAPNNRRRPAASGKRRFPGDMIGGGPAIRQVRVVRYASGARPAELRPVLCGAERRYCSQQHKALKNLEHGGSFNTTPGFWFIHRFPIRLRLASVRNEAAACRTRSRPSPLPCLQSRR